MSTAFLDTLPKAQRADLALCGIGSDAQLARSDVRTLHRDIEQARDFFPELSPGLTQEQLAALIAAAQRAVHTEAPPPAASPAASLPSPIKARRFEAAVQQAPRVKSSVLTRAIRYAHPIRIWLASLSVLLLLPTGFLALYLIGISLMTPPEEVDNLLFLLLWLPILLAPYCLFGRYQECCVCHVQLFRFRGYHRHANTARYFLLGPTFSTALRIVFMRPFFCPGCGTFLKLTRRHHSHS